MTASIFAIFLLLAILLALDAFTPITDNQARWLLIAIMVVYLVYLVINDRRSSK